MCKHCIQCVCVCLEGGREEFALFSLNAFGLFSTMDICDNNLSPRLTLFEVATVYLFDPFFLISSGDFHLKNQ